MRDKETKEAFIKYLNNHEEQRLYQAILNFTKEYISEDIFKLEAVTIEGLAKDTYFWDSDYIHMQERFK